MCFHLNLRRAGSVLLPALLVAGLLLQVCPAPGQSASTRRTAAHSVVADRETALENLIVKAQTAQNNSHFAEAAAAYAKATDLEPGIAELWANRGLMEHLAGKTELALASFQHALTINAELLTPLLFSAEDRIALKQPEVALSLLDRAAALHPQNPDIALTRAKAFTMLDRQSEAATAYLSATHFQPSNPAAWYGLAVSSLASIEKDGAMLAHTNNDGTWTKALYADELLTQGRLTEGTKFYTEVGEKAAPQERCKLERELESSEAAELAFLSAETRSHLQEALHANPADCTCDSGASSSAACAYLAGDYTFSRTPANSRTIAAVSPATPEALYWSIRSDERLAVLALSHFEELSPQSPATFDLTGDLYRRQSIPERARLEYAKALAIDAKNPAALLGTAAAYLSESHPGEALTFARRGLADRPEDPKLNLAAAEALVSQHKLDEAEPYLRMSLRGSGDSAAFAHALIGRVAASKGQTDAAIRELRLGLSTDQDGSLHYQLFRLLRKTGDTAGANAAEAEARALVQRRMAHATTALQNMQEASPDSN